MKLYIYHSHLCELGGCETVLYNLCEQLKDWYDLKVLYLSGDIKQVIRLSEIVDIELYDKTKTYNCDYMINNSVWGEYPDKINSSKNTYIQMIHADYEVLKQKKLFTYVKHDKVTHHVACGEFVAKQFTKVTGYECIAIKNILANTLPINKIYKFIYAGRIFDKDKNVSLERIQKFINMLENANIKYRIDIYTKGTSNVFNNNENVRIMKPKYYDIHDELADADYCILFSQDEGLPCQVQESLQYGTPCIVTANGGNMELIKHGINGYIVPMDMDFDINIIKKIPKVENYNNGVSAKTWCDFIGGSEYKPKKKRNDTKIKVTVVKGFKDVHTKEQYTVGKELQISTIRYKEIQEVEKKENVTLIKLRV